MEKRRKEGRTHWEALQHQQPPAPATLRVRGWPAMPTPLHIPMLRRAEQQGPDSRVLVLELTAIAPVHPAPQIVTPVFVHYEERTGREYHHVKIWSAAPTEPDAAFEVQTPHLTLVRDDEPRSARAQRG